MELSILRDLLVNHFNLSELINLSFDLGIDPENLAGQTKEDKARELILYCTRRDELSRLIERCKQLRPYASWDNVHLDTMGMDYRSPYELAQDITNRILANKARFNYNPAKTPDFQGIQISDIVNHDPELHASIQLYRRLPKHNIDGFLHEIQKQIVKLQNQLLIHRVEKNDLGLQTHYKNDLRQYETETQLRLYTLALETLSGDLYHE